jgi:hypothetical protein
MTTADQKLDSSLVWDHEHLGEPALQALADGELAILPEDAVLHVAACRRCDQRLAAVALQAIDIATVLAARVPASVPAVLPARRAFPLPAFAVAVAIAVVGLIVELVGTLGGAASWPSLVAHASPVLMRGLRLAFAGASGNLGLVAAPWVAAALLVLAGVLIARRAPVRLNLKGPA